ncbi:Signal transduction histidine kinase [Cyclobacterium xiamenense]|uniref:histidine kinase n=1 Tax=Cyclobacterium xiamenense TaxID=1297121 RepID=A0A1H7AMG7_9BACT|nr:tetratricopeptide repeat-containing sensor histidine kinase [Cyclobacterium xiamenense]SEJ65067.1 Signal transduction histidine kinase [Cyclobacterium xiamenense]
MNSVTRFYFWSSKTYFHCFLYFLGFYGLIGCQSQVESYQPISAETTEILDRSSNLLNSGQYRRSMQFLDSAYQQIGNKTPLDWWEKYNFLSRIYLKYDVDLNQSRVYLDSMFWVLKDRSRLYQKEYAQTKFLEGDWYKAGRDFEKAFASYFEGREFAQANLSDCLISNLTYQLGIFRYEQQQYAASIPYFKQAIEENEDCWDADMMDQNLYFPQMYRNTLGLAYEKTGALDSAAYFYQKGLTFLETIEKRYPGEKKFISLARGVILGNLGGVLASLGKTQDAERFLKESIAINSQPNFDVLDALTAKIKLAELFISQNRLQEAEQLLVAMDSVLSGSELKNRAYVQGRIHWSKAMGTYFEKQGALDKAYPFLKTHYQLRDSLDLADNALKTVDMEASLQNAAQQYQLSLINRDNQIKTIYLVATIGFTVLLVIFLGFIWQGLSRSKNINKVISQQNIELQETLGALEQSQAENTKIMYMVAHDLRNPISSMVMMADILLSDEQISGENRVLLGHIKTSCNNSLNLVSEMMQSNKNAASFSKEAVDIDRLLNYCVELLQHKAHEKNQKLILETIPVTAFVSREKLWRVISNLIANAVKFSPKGKSIRISMKKTSEKVIVSIKDEGIGIPESIKNKVFEWYTDGKRSGTDGEKPFGMGLAISKQIIAAHGGTIWFESEENKGTTFYIEIPIKAQKS